MSNWGNKKLISFYDKTLKKKNMNSKLSIRNERNNHIKTRNGESTHINRILEKESLQG